MTDYPVRLFPSDAAIRRVGEELLACSLPKPDWTHEAHLAACAWLLLERASVLPERDLPAILRRYNVAVGGVNDDTQGYHHTLTLLYIAAVRRFLAGADPASGLLATVNALLASDCGRRDWPFTLYSRETLFSVAARRTWIEPDRGAL